MNFMSSVCFILKNKTFIINEDLIIENEIGKEIFFIMNGKVSLIHKKTKSFIKEL